MNRRWITILPLLALLVAPAALAQDLDTRGTLTAKDETTLTIETVQGQVVSFEINEQSLLPEDLSVGDTITVHHLAGLGDSNLQAITEVLIADDLTGTPSDEVAATPSDEVAATPSDEVAATPSDEVAATPSDELLPDTASPLAALALIGLAATGGAAGLRRRRS